jgi:hypothetical protein
MNLTDERDTIVKEVTIKGSAERIFEALTNPRQRMNVSACCPGPTSRSGCSADLNSNSSTGHGTIVRLKRGTS